MEWASGNEILWLCAPASHLNYERDAGEGRGSTCVRASFRVGFPDDDLLWRIEWVAGVGYNANVPMWNVLA